MSLTSSINHNFYQSIETHLSAERLMAYGQDGADELTILSRYHLNVALSEALYPALQTAEVALRNSIHSQLAKREKRTDWYQSMNLPNWQSQQVASARVNLNKSHKPITPGRIIAELTFGFWVSFLTNAHIKSGVAYSLSKECFPHAKKSDRAFHNISPKWQKVRKLRNRIFHHERILHWSDLDQQHQDILELIHWMNPSLYQSTCIIDRFPTLRAQGLEPWTQKFSQLQDRFS